MDDTVHVQQHLEQLRLTEAAVSSSSELRSIVGVLLRHWKLIASVPLVAALIAFGVLHLIPPLYKSTVELLVVDPKQPANAADDRPLSAFEVSTSAMDNEIAMMSSQSLALRVAKDLGLDRDSEFTQSTFSILA